MLRTSLGALAAGLLVAGPVAVAVHERDQMRNFRVVRPGVLYRSGQMSVAGLRRAMHDYGIRTVVTLRDPADGESGAADRAEEEFCRQQELTYVRIPPRKWDLRGGVAPVDEGICTFLKVMNDPRNYPVLVHCFAGIHRTGAYCAVYRMEHEGWPNARAIAEVKACGYERLDVELDILDYLEQYRPGYGSRCD